MNQIKIDKDGKTIYADMKVGPFSSATINEFSQRKDYKGADNAEQEYNEKHKNLQVSFRCLNRGVQVDLKTYPRHRLVDHKVLDNLDAARDYIKSL